MNNDAEKYSLIYLKQGNLFIKLAQAICISDETIYKEQWLYSTVQQCGKISDCRMLEKTKNNLLLFEINT